ncbi:hypothetical protein SAMN05421850_10348 [Lutimaribacter saemankumensis]|uniref:Uncharacterized protein n=1 Tax=Lutimaribacter saemankumensis TaxID=490829 RepID=A0A1G8KWC8_9RHOB|nr:hypothetical protein SAMN05421850_10348 [Lutimaribacter saemankumensis]
MIVQLFKALFRAVLVAVLVALPALALPSASDDGPQIVVLISIIIALLVFLEYNSAYPSFVEFRYAPPINRLRFGALFLTVAVLSAVCADENTTSTIGAIAASLAGLIAGFLDIPFSPVRLIGLILPADAPATLVETLRIAAGFAYFVSLCIVGLFFLLVHVAGWPARHGAFNVWINLPLFDPTAGSDVVTRLRRHGLINLVLGFLLPFLLPAVAKAASGIVDPMILENEQTMIWVVSLWAILPASMMIRGIAMNRIAQMILQKRERAYAAAQAAGDGEAASENDEDSYQLV